jgi:hypothetical protein
MLGVGCALEEPLKISRAPYAVDLGSIYFLQAEDISFKPVKLRAEDGGALLEGSRIAM